MGWFELALQILKLQHGYKQSSAIKCEFGSVLIYPTKQGMQRLPIFVSGFDYIGASNYSGDIFF